MPWGTSPGVCERRSQTVRFSLRRGYLAGLALAAATITLVAGGCIPAASPQAGVVTLRAWTMWGSDEAGAFQAALDEFNRTHPTIQVRNLPAVDDPKIIRAIVANDPPEIFTLRDPGYLGSLAANGALRRLDQDFRTSGLDANAFAPGSLSQCRFRGHLYAMIYVMDVMALLRNTEAFREAGIQEPPKTLNELLKLAERLTLREKDGSIRRLGLLPPDPVATMVAFGGGFVDPTTGMPTADHPRNIEALEWYRQLIEVQGGGERVNAFAAGFGPESGINNPFLVNKVAMTINGQWNPYWFQRFGPKVPYAASPLPRPDAHPELDRPTWIGGNLFCIPANCRYPAQAWEFLRWTQTPAAQALFAGTIHGVPNISVARRDPTLRQGERWKEAFSVFMDAADSPNCRHFPVTPITGLYQYELTNAADYVRYGTKTPTQALRDVQGRVSREMAQWR